MDNSVDMSFTKFINYSIIDSIIDSINYSIIDSIIDSIINSIIIFIIRRLLFYSLNFLYQSNIVNITKVFVQKFHNI